MVSHVYIVNACGLSSGRGEPPGHFSQLMAGVSGQPQGYAAGCSEREGVVRAPRLARTACRLVAGEARLAVARRFCRAAPAIAAVDQLRPVSRNAGVRTAHRVGSPLLAARGVPPRTIVVTRAAAHVARRRGVRRWRGPRCPPLLLLLPPPVLPARYLRVVIVRLVPLSVRHAAVPRVATLLCALRVVNPWGIHYRPSVATQGWARNTILSSHELTKQSDVGTRGPGHY